MMFLFLIIALVFCSAISILLIFFFWRERCKTTLDMKLIRRRKEMELGQEEKKDLQISVKDIQVNIEQELPAPLALITVCRNCQRAINNEEEEEDETQVERFIDAVDCGGGGDGHSHQINNTNDNNVSYPKPQQCREV
jgi:hypothetical protein